MLMEIKSSMSILFSGKVSDGAKVEAISAPVTSTESLVAARGLSRHLGIIYRGVEKNSNSETALNTIYSFLTDEVDSFMQQAANLDTALRPKGLIERRVYSAAALAYLVSGHRSHRLGVWLKGSKRDEQLRQTMGEILAQDELTFYEFADWGRRQAVKNGIFWQQQVEAARDSKCVAELLSAIEISDHQPAEV
jgi:hypothetical protein